MILPIYLYGQPVLRKEAAEVEMPKEELSQLLADMYETLAQADGCGLAAASCDDRSLEVQSCESGADSAHW